MKKMILLGLMLSSVNAFAVKLDCGLKMGIASTLEFEKNTGDTDGGHKDYVGVYMAPGKDATTGTLLRSKAYELSGYKETVEGYGPSYVLINLQSQLTVLVEDKAFKKGGKVKVTVANLRTNSEEELSCKVK